jgi:hypothetical protein
LTIDRVKGFEVSQPEKHSALLATAARSVLAPLGIVQKGRSRVWLDDRGWWLGVVEFQPSSWSKGSYVNVAAMWLWHEQDNLSFDYGDRVERFANYSSDVQFESEAQMLAESAKRRIQEHRVTFKCPADVARVMSERPRTEWNSFHTAVAYGCAGDVERARWWFAHLAQSRAEFDWHRRLLHRARELDGMLSNLTEFRAAIEAAIRATRLKLKLSDIDLADFYSLPSEVSARACNIPSPN